MIMQGSYWSIYMIELLCLKATYISIYTDGGNKCFGLLLLREAAEDAGFDVLRVISQPAAAALAYGKVKDWNRLCLITFNQIAHLFGC